MTVPTTNLLDKFVKALEKKLIGVLNTMRYNGKPRLGTVKEVLRVTIYVNKHLCDVSISSIVINSSADVVTNLDVSRELSEQAKSKDKTLKIYDGMVHSLLSGKPNENVEIVRCDILLWLNDRCK
ncbi:caffeoylshikimate esterase-like [Camellia sinensis]|uniref:caffeoylshikimate esterase-like n=1 Tax=Camellia sinensis TaxID=4442 RepID=UPI00103641D7|nr:caffeoylshikimate esterase-like [Camellia sinensis]